MTVRQYAATAEVASHAASSNGSSGGRRMHSWGDRPEWLAIAKLAPAAAASSQDVVCNTDMPSCHFSLKPLGLTALKDQPSALHAKKCKQWCNLVEMAPLTAPSKHCMQHYIPWHACSTQLIVETCTCVFAAAAAAAACRTRYCRVWAVAMK
jgi:hypothetical protein